LGRNAIQVAEKKRKTEWRGVMQEVQRSSALDQHRAEVAKEQIALRASRLKQKNRVLREKREVPEALAKVDTPPGNAGRWSFSVEMLF